MCSEWLPIGITLQIGFQEEEEEEKEDSGVQHTSPQTQ